MDTYAGRKETMKRTEELFERCKAEQFPEMERRLAELGYIQRGSDPASAEFQHKGAGLKLEVEFDGEGRIHSYELLTTEEMEDKQRKFRW